MATIVILIVLLALYHWLDTPDRNKREQEVNAAKRLRIKNTDHRISYIELAQQHRDLKTARNMIELGLVKESGEPNDKYVKLIYEGYFTEENNCRNNHRARSLGHLYHLLPSNPGFVGDYPKDPNRRYTA